MKLIATACAALALLAGISPPAALAQSANTVSQGQGARQIEPTRFYLNLSRSIKVTPDAARFRIEISSSKANSAEASEAVNRQMLAVRPLIEAAVTSRSDIETAEVSVHKQEERESTDETPRIWFEAGVSIGVVVRDISKLPDLLRELSNIDGVETSDVGFFVSNYRDLQAQLRREILASAMTEANTYAAAGGLRVLRIAAIGDNWEAPSMAADRGRFPDSNLAESLQRIQGVAINRFASSTNLTLYPGEQTITESTNFTFELVPN